MCDRVKPVKTREGEVVCSGCGQVLSELELVNHPTGSPEGLRFNPRSAEERSRWGRLEKRSRRLRSGYDRRLVAFAERCCEFLGLPRSLAEEAVKLLNFRARHSKRVLAALAVWQIARERGFLCPLRRVKMFLRGAFPFRSVDRIVLTGLMELAERGIKSRPREVEDYVPFVVGRLRERAELGASEVAGLARELARGREWGGCDPLVSAAACVYAACRELGLGISAREAAEAAGVSEEGVRDSFLRSFPELVRRRDFSEKIGMSEHTLSEARYTTRSS